MNRVTIDIWNVKSYDAELLAELNLGVDLVCRYVEQDKMNGRLRRLESYRGPPPCNPHARAFHGFKEFIIMPMMSARKIRGWHYTRLTDAEAGLLRREGIYPSTLASTKRRLNALVVAGSLSAKQAEALYSESPLHHPKQTVRSNKFWMSPSPLPVNYGGIVPLLECWGGESVYFWQHDKALRETIARIGKSRVVEVSVPLSSTEHAYSAARSVLAHYGRSIGCEPDGENFDFYATQPLGPEAVLAIHTEGDPAFEILALGYPAEFEPRPL